MLITSAQTKLCGSLVHRPQVGKTMTQNKDILNTSSTEHSRKILLCKILCLNLNCGVWVWVFSDFWLSFHSVKSFTNVPTTRWRRWTQQLYLTLKLNVLHLNSRGAPVQHDWSLSALSRSGITSTQHELQLFHRSCHKIQWLLNQLYLFSRGKAGCQLTVSVPQQSLASCYPQ